MSRASRRSRREEAKRANNAKLVVEDLVPKQHCHSESKEERMQRMRRLYEQNKKLGEKS